MLRYEGLSGLLNMQSRLTGVENDKCRGEKKGKIWEFLHPMLKLSSRSVEFLPELINRL